MTLRHAFLPTGLALVALAPSANAEVVKAPAPDFGLAAVACSAALTSEKLDFGALERRGWNKGETRGPITVYQRDGVGVRLLLSKMFANSGQCVVDGYATADDQFPLIRDAIRDALSGEYGSKLKMLAPVVAGGQGYTVGDLVQILSSERRPDGLSIRVTGMNAAKFR